MKLKLRELTYQYVLSLNLPQNHRDKYCYFLYLLRNNNKKEYRYLSSALLKSILGKNSKSLSYIDIIRTLTDNGVIECDNISIPGAKSLGYRLSKKFSDGRLVEVELKTKHIIRNIEIGSLKKWEALPQYIRSQKENFSHLTLDGHYIGETRVSRGRTGRVYNFITGHKSIIRPYLRYQDNELLFGLDGKNFQPYLLGLIVCEGLKIQSIDEEMPDNLRKYLSLVEQGKLYTYFAEKMNADISTEKKREAFKKKFFKGYFFNKKYNVLNNSAVGIIFKNDFPTIHDYILNNFINKKKTLAYSLQVNESKMFIEDIYQSFYKQGIWAVTNHDCIICRESDLNTVKQQMEYYFRQRIISPVLDIKEWNNEGGTHLDEKIVRDHINTGRRGSGRGVYKCGHFSQKIAKVYTPLPYFEDYGVQCKSKNDWLKLEKREMIWREVGECNFYKRQLSVKGIHRKTNINKATIREHLTEMRNRFDFDMISKIFMLDEVHELEKLKEEEYVFIDGELYRMWENYLSINAEVNKEELMEQTPAYTEDVFAGIE
jgi:hypothetical protein